MVISKMVLPHPPLDIKFLKPIGMLAEIFILYTSIYTLMVHIIRTTNYRDVFILLTFFLGGGVQKMEIWNFEKYELSLRLYTFGSIFKNKL